ncbi:MgtC/SapB family protein [Bradyrhizobium sp. B124]|uniref:MgtC/SapB family protein n=1 Tax=Bradyrhizobium sp. B124 TaxID=3140245 RepID=UPI003184001E
MDRRLRDDRPNRNEQFHLRVGSQQRNRHGICSFIHLGRQSHRLALTILASAIIGFDAVRAGTPPGLRTTILVGIAASLSMIQANLLLTLEGKDSGSFAVVDLMRLPLGIF